MVLIRSILEQSAVVWHFSLSEENKQDFERVQKTCQLIVELAPSRSSTIYLLKKLRIPIQILRMSPKATLASKKPSATCDECKRTFSSKQALTNHIKSVHDGIKSLKNLFSIPKALLNQKRLFTSVPNLSTQGNSLGQVNDPKVVTEAEYICGDCDQRCATEDEMKLQKRDIHDNGNAADINEEETITNELNDDQENDQDMVKLVAEYEEDLLENKHAAQAAGADPPR